MKRIFLPVLIHFSIITFGQNTCSSLRYQDSVFHNVTVTTTKFGSAVPYLGTQPQDLYFDFYEPTGDTLTKRPLIIFQFGGGFTIGWRSEPVIPQFCTYFAQCGYAVASIDYRIGLNPLDMGSTTRAYYRGVQDERAAIRYIAARASQFRIDTSLIILTGTSAGCFCAFANAFTSDADRPASTFGTLLEPTDLGCMDCSGNNDLGHYIPRIKAIINQWGAIIDTSYIETHENTPVLSLHGDQDVLVPYTYGYPFQLPVFLPVYGSVPIHERLNNTGILNQLHTLVGYGHEPELLAPQLNDTIYRYSREFLFNLLKPNTSEISGDTFVCNGVVARYSVANTPGSKYCWNIAGNGNIILNIGNEIEVMWSDTGTVSVSVREQNYIDAEGELKTFNTYVAPAVHASFIDSVEELYVQFVNTTSGAENYAWNFGDNTSSDSLNAEKKYASGGTYTVTLIASNPYCADTFSSSITIDSCPVADITYQLNNYNGFFYTPTTNTISYSWNFGDGDSASVHYPSVFHPYKQNGEYMITLEVRNQIGCVRTDTIYINVNVTSINDFAEAHVYVVAENNELIIFGLSNDKIYTAELFNTIGQRVAHNTITSSDSKMSTHNLANGLYILKISYREETAIRKLIIFQ